MKRLASKIVQQAGRLSTLLSFLDQISLINEHVVLYKTFQDVTICLVGRSEDSNELLLYTAVETIFDALSEIIK